MTLAEAVRLVRSIQDEMLRAGVLRIAKVVTTPERFEALEMVLSACVPCAELTEATGSAVIGNDLAIVMRAIRPLDCGALYCRYCRAGQANQWQHDEHCVYEQSVKDADTAQKIVSTLRVQMARRAQ